MKPNTRGTFWKRNARRLPRPWRHYAACHGTLRGCHWFPRWRDAAMCRIRGHRWREIYDDGTAAMCERCAVGPISRDRDESWLDIDEVTDVRPYSTQPLTAS